MMQECNNMSAYGKGLFLLLSISMYIIVFNWIWFKVTGVLLMDGEFPPSGLLFPFLIPLVLWILLYALPLLIGTELL